MHPSRFLQAIALAMAVLLPAAAEAQPRPTFTLNAALGGAVPYSRRDSFVVARLAGGQQAAPRFSLSSALPMTSITRPIFDARPQLVLNGGMQLGEWAGTTVSLNAYVSTGVLQNAPEEPRPLLGLAALRFLF